MTSVRKNVPRFRWLVCTCICWAGVCVQDPPVNGSPEAPGSHGHWWWTLQPFPLQLLNPWVSELLVQCWSSVSVKILNSYASVPHNYLNPITCIGLQWEGKSLWQKFSSLPPTDVAKNTVDRHCWHVPQLWCLDWCFSTFNWQMSCLGIFVSTEIFIQDIWWRPGILHFWQVGDASAALLWTTLRIAIV